VLNEVKPGEAVFVNESTSNTDSFWQRIGLDRARSFYFPAAGALGFGIPAAVGVQLAESDRPVIGVIGDGSANYAITGLWSAAHYRVPATFVILRNDEYGVLKWFAGALKATGLPGLDLPGIDYCAVAQGYGVRAVRIASRDELAAALLRSVASDSPSLIEVPHPRRRLGSARLQTNRRCQVAAPFSTGDFLPVLASRTNPTFRIADDTPGTRLSLSGIRFTAR